MAVNEREGVEQGVNVSSGDSYELYAKMKLHLIRARVVVPIVRRGCS